MKLSVSLGLGLDKIISVTMSISHFERPMILGHFGVPKNAFLIAFASAGLIERLAVPSCKISFVIYEVYISFEVYLGN